MHCPTKLKKKNVQITDGQQQKQPQNVDETQKKETEEDRNASVN